MIKEKVIFWPLLAVFIGVLIFGFGSQGKKREAKDELLQDIELATKRSMAKKKAIKDKWDLGKVKAVDVMGGYNLLLKRSPFFKVQPKGKSAKKPEPIPVKEEEPKGPLFKYKGRMTMGSAVKVIIEDQGTGKSFFVEEGDMVGDFLVSRINEKGVTLKKRDGEELVLSAVKKEE